MAPNTKKISLSPDVADDAATYASALDEIGGKKNPGLAELILDDPEEPAAVKALKALAPAKRIEVEWILGWFRGVADVRGCDPLAVLRAGRAAGIKFDGEAA
jgi:hypothetical protein